MDREQLIQLRNIHFNDQLEATMAEAKTVHALRLPPDAHDSYLTTLQDRLEDIRAQKNDFWARPDVRGY